MPDERMAVELSLGAVVIQDTALWGWDNEKSVTLATGSPEKRRVEYVCEDGTVAAIGSLSLTVSTQMIQTDAGLFVASADVVYPVADEMFVTLINPRGQIVAGIQPKANYRRSRR